MPSRSLGEFKIARSESIPITKIENKKNKKMINLNKLSKKKRN